jgi:predicted RND superfamily exporter protein
MANFGKPHDEDEDENGLSAVTRENIAGTIPWLQAVAFIGFGSLGLSLFSMLRSGQMSGVLGLAVSFILALFLFQQATALKKFIDGGNKSDYNEALKHESNYWLVQLILLGIAVGVIALVFVVVLIALAAGAFR